MKAKIEVVCDFEVLKKIQDLRGMVSHICCASTSDPRHNTLPCYESGESLHTSCDTVVPLPFCRRESMCR